MNWRDWIGNLKFTKKILFYITYTVVLIFALFNLKEIGSWIGHFVGMAYPFIMGISIAFVVNVLLKFYEERVFAFLNRRGSRLWEKCRRGVCVFLSFLTLILILTAIIVYVVPEFVSSLMILVDNAPVYIERLSGEATRLLSEFNITQEQINSLSIDWSSLITKATELTTGLMDSVVVVTTSIANGVFTVAMGFIFCMYLLFGKEKLIGNLKRVIYAYLPRRAAHRLIEVGALSNRIFSNFVRGQLTEACIWFVMIYVVLTFILRLPYAVLISCIVALCSLVPIIGPYISMFTAGFILLLVNPWYTLTYIIAFLILQQIEGNLIYPRVVGTSVGLPGIWVLFAIIVCGNLMGIAGILLGIPTFSVIYTLLRQSTARRLRARHITSAQAIANNPSGLRDVEEEDEDLEELEILDGLEPDPDNADAYGEEDAEKEEEEDGR